MSRQARRLSETGLYHIIFRGINTQDIFNEPADYIKLKEILRKVKTETSFSLYAYCFMTNHVHMFMKEQNPGEISKIMTKILSHYATWFNRKYSRSGALFNNRYKSEPVEDDEYLINLVRYIHQNPVKAHISKTPNGYAYSSYGEYIDNDPDITDIDFVLEVLDENRDSSLTEFAELHKITETEDFEISDTRKRTTAQILRIIKSESGGINPSDLKTADRSLRDSIIKKLVEEKGISKSEITRATGLSRTTVSRICNGMTQKLPRPQNVSQPILPTHLM